MSILPPIVDSHCHLDRLDLTQFDGKLDNAIQAARDNGVVEMLCVSVVYEDAPQLQAIVSQHDDVKMSVGVHPTEYESHDPTVEELVELASLPKVVAIGETGLDYHYPDTDRAKQQARFRNHIRAAKEVNKPLIIHTRDAREDTIQILKEEQAETVGGVLHCFTETLEMALAGIELNFYVSFSGIITFKNAQSLRDVVSTLPLEKLLIETDAPYLAPVPQRGKPNHPALVRHVCEKVAEIKDVSIEAVAKQTTQNYHKLFNTRN